MLITAVGMFMMNWANSIEYDGTFKYDVVGQRGTLWTKILQSQNNKCNICHKRFTKKRPPTQDHIVPISKGGSLQSENIQALCRSCNSSKHIKLDEEYIQTWIHNRDK